MIYYHVSSNEQEGNWFSRTKYTHDFEERVVTIVENTPILCFENYVSLHNQLHNAVDWSFYDHSPFKWSCEAIFESVRKEYYDEKPSRIRGIFVTDSIDRARAFIDDIRGGNGKIFEIELPPSLETFDMKLFSLANKGLSHNFYLEHFNDAVKFANAYWSGEHISNQLEWLYDAENYSVQVGRKVFQGQGGSSFVCSDNTSSVIPNMDT